jgi:guanidinopropionase
MTKPISEAVLDQRAAEMEPWYWHGPATFFKCPWNADPAACDIGLVGVPHSSGNGSTERDQHLAPRAVRHISGWYRRAHQKFRIKPWDAFRIHDLGDVPLPEAMVNDICVDHIEEFYTRLDAAGTRPVSIGGDHSITGPILRALGGAEAKLSQGCKLALVHFDAHRDDYEYLPHWLGSKRSAAHWAAYTIHEGIVDPAHSIQLGMRGNPMRVRDDPTRSDMGYRILTSELIFELGLEESARLIRERVGDLPVYITFDLDALDPCDAPAVANLEPGYRALRTYEAIRLLQALRGVDIVGADIVCMIPSKDTPCQITAMTSVVLMFEMISLIADRLRSQRQSPAAAALRPETV